MTKTVDDVVRGSHRSKDEKQWEREQKAKRRKGTPPAFTSPACGDCAMWTAGQPYGACSALAVLSFLGKPEASSIRLRSDIRLELLPMNAEVKPLRTAAGFRCPAWTERQP